MNLAKAFLEYYHCIGVIPTQLLKEIPSKKKRPKRRFKRNKDRFRPDTTRRSAQVHVKDISITYDSEISLEAFSYRAMGSPVGILKNRRFNQKLEDVSDHYIVSLTEPTLSIIDMNEMLTIN